MVNEETFKQIIAKNLTKYRKINNLTQADLALKLSYSDKAISKWERGESLPDVYTLSKLAEFYGITLNDLCSETIIPFQIKKTKKTNQLFICLLSATLVWFIATLLFVIFKLIPQTENYPIWLIFIAAIPTTFIVLCVYACLWYNNNIRSITVSGIVWGCAVLLQLLFNHLGFKNGALIYTIAATLQLLVILWFTRFFVQEKIRKMRKK